MSEKQLETITITVPEDCDPGTIVSVINASLYTQLKSLEKDSPGHREVQMALRVFSHVQPSYSQDSIPENKQVRFKNIAGVDSNTAVNVCLKELFMAGIDALKMPFILGNREVKSNVIGALDSSGWSFNRAWSYWIARGPGIPPEDADRLYRTHGKNVRVTGHALAPSPDYTKGFAVSLYHVDTQEGLEALADMIKEILARPDRNLAKASDKEAGDR